MFVLDISYHATLGTGEDSGRKEVEMAAFYFGNVKSDLKTVGGGVGPAW